MQEPESYGEEGFGERETTDGAGRRGRELRDQAELAWARVQRVLQQGKEPTFSTEEMLERVEQLPTATYVAGIAGSFFASAILLALGRRSTSALVGLGGPLVLGVALYFKLARQARRI